MNLIITPQAGKTLSRLPKTIQKKTQRQFNFLLSNYRHPSLRSRKMAGTQVFEARIDIHYRFTFQVEQETVYILTVGHHDEGLGKK